MLFRYTSINFAFRFATFVLAKARSVDEPRCEIQFLIAFLKIVLDYVTWTVRSELHVSSYDRLPVKETMESAFLQLIYCKNKYYSHQNTENAHGGRIR